MDSQVSPVGQKYKSKRKSSRFGCRNCKLRKLKCDETRPYCSRCRTYGVYCNFGFNVSDLQPVHQKQTKEEVVSLFDVPRPRSIISNAIWVDDGLTYFTLDPKDQMLFNRFRYLTIHSLGGSEMVHIWESHMLQACFNCPFLMHGTLAVAAVHERYFEMAPTYRRSLRESYHVSQFITLFSKRLSQPIREEHKDTLWAAAGTVAILTFSAFTASSPDEAWPLGAPDASDLDWLRLGVGKMKLWQLLNPLRPESVHRIIFESIVKLYESVPTRGTNGVLVELVQLCGLDQSSTPENNPFFTVAHGLSQLLEAPKGRVSLDSIMKVWNLMNNRFVVLLEMKDPAALLLLYLWYTRARESGWWISIRAKYEIPAIRTYLETYHGDNSVLQALIQSL
ncbi:hypothetical protein GGI43DRAFT_432401 [Trichoderma evansii]